MIVIDLDGTLADCSHRRHFVDKSYLEGCDHWHQIPNHPVDLCNECKDRFKKWKPNWKAFYEACDKDEPIWTTINLINLFLINDMDINIWSGRCESVKDKTILWLKNYLDVDDWFYRDCIKMRPMGDYTPDDQLKERWLDEHIARGGKPIDMVFDDRESCCNMWNNRGIMCFLIKDAHDYRKNNRIS